jgi:hypothetical protein
MDFTARVAKIALASAIGLIGAALSQSLSAGSLNRCDLARIAAHNAVLSGYEQLLAALDRKISEARANGDDPTKAFILDAPGEARPVSLVALTAELNGQEQTDAGHADKQALRDCGDDSNAVEKAKQTADSLVSIGISTVMSNYGMRSTDLSRILPRS